MRTTWTGGALLLASALSLLLPAHAHSSEFVVPYRGELVDDRLAPLSGVFELTFEIRRRPQDTRPVWAESHFVSVVEGLYDVDLGHTRTIAEEDRGRELTLTVRMGADIEIAAHPFVVEARPPAEESSLPDIERIVFADLSDRALRAERARTADDCRTLDGRTAQELDRSNEILQRVAELQERLRQQQQQQPASRSGPTTGTPTQTLPRIGGAGGSPFDRACPPGHVMTGLRGGAGELIDSIVIVCAPLQ